MRRHGTDAVSLGFGVLFIAIAAWWAAGRYLLVDLDVPNLGWIAAAALILFGLIGVIASLRGDREGRREPTDATMAMPVDTVPQGSTPVDTVTSETVDTVPTAPTPEEPVWDEPASDEAVPDEPELGEPELGEPELGEPELGEPELGEPELGEPELGEPAAQERPDPGEGPRG